MIDFDLGVIFCYEGCRYVCENEPAYVDADSLLSSDSQFPSFRAFCVRVPKYDPIVPSCIYPVFYVEFVVRMDVLESDKYDWSDADQTYHRTCSESEIVFPRDAYLAEPVELRRAGVGVEGFRLPEILRMRI